MKKIMMILIFVSFVFAVFATGMPVVDVAHIAETIKNAIDTANRWQVQLRQYEDYYRKAQRAAESIASGDYMAVVDGLVEFSGLMKNFRTSPKAIDEHWLKSVENNINKAGVVGESVGIPIASMFQDNVMLTHNFAMVKKTITKAIKRFQDLEAGKTLVCMVCGGSGRRWGTCPDCNGTRYNSILHSWESTQEYEFGEFLESCKTCAGTGHVDRECENCHGTGRVGVVESGTRVSVDAIVGLLGNGANILSGIGSLLQNFQDLTDAGVISYAEYRENLEKIRDSFLNKYLGQTKYSVSLQGLDEYYADIGNEIFKRQEELKKLDVAEEVKKVKQLEVTIDQLKLKEIEIGEFRKNLNELQVQINRLKPLEVEEYKWETRKKMNDSLRRVYSDVERSHEFMRVI